MDQLSWVVGFGPNLQRGKTKYPAWGDIEEQLIKLRDYSGSVTIRYFSDNEVEFQKLHARNEDDKRVLRVREIVKNLEVQAEGGYFMLMLGEIVDEDHKVRTYNNPSLAGKQIEILGNCWGGRDVCQDLEIVVKIFREFFETGNVSHQLLA